MLIHREALELANNAGDENSDRYCLQFVQVTEHGDVIATDGHHFLRMKAKVDEPSLFDVFIPENVRDSAGTVLIASDALSSFSAACKKMGETAHVAIAAENGTITLASADGKTERTFITKPPDLPFPDIDKVVPTGLPPTEVLLSVPLLQKLLKTLKACGCESVKLAVRDKETAVGLSAFSESGLIDGAIMPMRE